MDTASLSQAKTENINQPLSFQYRTALATCSYVVVQSGSLNGWMGHIDGVGSFVGNRSRTITNSSPGELYTALTGKPLESVPQYVLIDRAGTFIENTTSLPTIFENYCILHYLFIKH